MNSTTVRKRPRGVRVTSLELAPGALARALEALRRGDVLLRIGLAFLAAVALWAVSLGWLPPFPYHVGFVPQRNITARVAFQVEDPRAIALDTQNKNFLNYEKGEALAIAGEPLQPKTVDLLVAEYQAYIRSEAFSAELQTERSLAMFGLIAALLGLSGYYVYVRDRRLIHDLKHLSLLLATACIAVLLARWAAADPWRAEIIPLLLFGMTVGIAHGRELALVLSLAVTMIFVLADGASLAQLALLLGIQASAIVQLGRIRSRRKLIWVGLISGSIAPVLTVAAGMLDGQPLRSGLLNLGAHNAVWTLLAGFLITGLLPFVEGMFGVLTEISLLELGDVAHPLLQELVRRAPGTYNHSINVASIAEAAAESIGARGLLVRVGAYFHDIGKMLKPHYFVENQGLEESRHDSLMPAMSTLIIIAHIKDGADLARQHRLPQPIIDLIEQHHGTTLVEYFFRRASQQSETDPDAGNVQESSFRYPGPKPQTVEAAVLMLADSVESASRALVEPTPSRIDSLVEEIAMKKLLDGQFDECGLTLQQLRKIEDSLAKSLTAVYHGRVKYPDQRTA
ncbi:MAG TPA: HDIG domain-containing protein [Pirellulales bacterium]|nr:HDIG domain-containing protein [Pirellulales bacterium]